MSGTLKKTGLAGSKGNITGNLTDVDGARAQAQPQKGRKGSPKKEAPKQTMDPKKAAKYVVLLIDGNEETFYVPVCRHLFYYLVQQFIYLHYEHHASI